MDQNKYPFKKKKKIGEVVKMQKWALFVLQVSSEILFILKLKSLSHIWLFVTPWTVACQAPPSIGFPRQEYWSGAISFSRGSSQPRDLTLVSHIAGRCFTIWTTREALKPSVSKPSHSSTLAGKSHGWKSLVGYSPWGREESDTTEWPHFHFSFSCTGEGNGNPLQCSCLENPRDEGAWWAAV